jgi:Uma2 family endonuclease
MSETVSIVDLEYSGSGREDQGYLLRRMTREEFHRAAETGVYDPSERLELIHGEVYEKLSPQSPRHYNAIQAASESLAEAFGIGYHVRQQGPIGIGDHSEPEPDIAVVKGSWRDFPDDPTPADVVLIVEVSDSTLSADRGKKAALYAEAAIADYWILNLPARRLEVYRDPAAIPDSPFGFGYKTIRVFLEEEAASPLAATNAVIKVSDLLPTPESPERTKGQGNV